MSKYSGQEGKIVSQSVFETLVANYEEVHGAEETFIKSDTIGFDKLDLLKVEGAVSLRTYNGNDGTRDLKIYVPVSETGEELPFGLSVTSRRSADKGIQSDPPHCPTQC